MDSSWLSALFGGVYLALIIAFGIHIIMQRRPVGVTLAWILLLFILPVAGFFFYLLFGSRRLGRRRLRRLESLYPDHEQWSGHLSRVIVRRQGECSSNTPHTGVYKLAEQTLDIPVLPCSKLQLFHETDTILHGLLQDIEKARQSIVLEFYICQPKGRIKVLAEALIRASQRGVDCMVILDAVGSRRFLRSEWARRFRREGISVTSSMPVGLLRMLFERVDIRNHRKILVIDDEIAWSGSFNLVDPVYFRQRANVGQWVDAMVRVEGIPAHVMGVIAHWDKALETGEKHSSFNATYEFPPSCLDSYTGADAHVLPSGPGINRERLHQVLLTAIYESKEELLISTPYFVPDESLLVALKSAAMRGVDVQLLLPHKNDSRMVHHASRSYYEDLLKAGVKILQFKGGLLHTKCVLVDRSTILFGTVNLDMRSVWLNYEVTMIIYDRAFSQTMATLLDQYMQSSERVRLSVWNQRSVTKRFLESLFQLLSPLL
ncbi:cardiolipin synthase [Endozoicomonas sp. 4G]|uniref:cardiolipin synthase n=1 Tax=Endozoicomonas sp. 4G TaxID=2872754 RepID=UPI002078CC3E|nr:cardiolipin synthase [Endozoicomonas sp. 4G]